MMELIRVAGEPSMTLGPSDATNIRNTAALATKTHAITITFGSSERRHHRTLLENNTNDNKNRRNNIRRIDEVINNNEDAERALESQFIQSCVETLTPAQDQESTSNNLEVSQVKFASFVILYCRDADGTAGSTSSDNEITWQHERGMQCTDTLFFFPDLPRILQLEFVRYTSCYSKNVINTSTEDDDNNNNNNNITTIDDCLDDYNEQGSLFYMEDSTRVSELCTFTYPLMISSDLISTSSSNASDAPVPTTATLPPSTAPLTGTQSLSPTIAPIDSTAMTPTTAPVDIIINSNGSDGLSTVGILGITITILFMIMFVYQLLVWKCKNFTTKSSKNDNSMAALQEDESVVASEHSHELGSTPICTIDEEDGEDDGDHPTRHWDFDKSTRAASTAPGQRRSWLLLRPSTPKSPSVTSATGRSPKQTVTSRRSQSPHYHHRFYFNSNNGAGSGDNRQSNSGSFSNNKFTYPKPLAIVTENLSEDNPVHTRKRFQNPKKSDAAGHFPFDEGSKNQSTNAPAASSAISGRVQPLSSTGRTGSSTNSNNHIQNISYKNGKTFMPPNTSVPQTQPSGPILPPLQQQSGKENTNNKRTGTRGTAMSQQKQSKITAVTFGDVIHTTLQREAEVVDVPIRIPVRNTSSTVLRPQQQQP